MPLYLRGHCNLAMLFEPASRRRHSFGNGRQLGFRIRARLDVWRRQLGDSRAAASQPMDEPDDHARRPARPAPPAGTGSVYLASKLGLPLVLLGMGYDRPWRMRSWDRFALPRPFSRARAVVSPAITIPPDLDRDGLEHYRQRIESLLTRLTDEAEAWAVAGTPKIGQVTVRANGLSHGPKMPQAAAECGQPAKVAISSPTSPGESSGRGQVRLKCDRGQH